MCSFKRFETSLYKASSLHLAFPSHFIKNNCRTYWHAYMRTDGLRNLYKSLRATKGNGKNHLEITNPKSNMMEPKIRQAKQKYNTWWLLLEMNLLSLASQWHVIEVIHGLMGEASLDVTSSTTPSFLPSQTHCAKNRIARTSVQSSTKFYLYYRVFRKNCVFFTIHCNRSLAYIAARDLQFSTALNAMRVYSHSYWLVSFCSTNRSRVLASER